MVRSLAQRLEIEAETVCAQITGRGFVRTPVEASNIANAGNIAELDAHNFEIPDYCVAQ